MDLVNSSSESNEDLRKSSTRSPGDIFEDFDQAIEMKIQEISFLKEDLIIKEKLLKGQKDRLQILEQELEMLRESRNHKSLLLTKSQNGAALATPGIQSWREYTELRDRGEVNRNLLKFLVRKGIPVELRNELWQRLAKVHRYNMNDMYQNLLKKTKGTAKHAAEIEQDVHRSLPEHVLFSKPDSPGVLTLKRTLIAYSQRNPKVGYCQGLGMIAACLLLIMEETEAYWMLCSTVENFLPADYFSHGLSGLMVDLKVLDDLVAIRLPECTAHFAASQFDLSLVSMNWLMTLFVAACPLETVYRIWDVFYSEGIKIIFCFAIGLLRYHQSEIMELNDAVSLSVKLKRMAADCHQCHPILLAAYHEMQVIKMDKINELRSKHRAPNKQVEKVVMERNFSTRTW